MTSLRARSLALGLSAISLAVLAPAPAEAQSRCNSVSNVVTAIWAKFGERIRAKGCKTNEECLANAQKKEELVREMIAFWNQQAQGSWATIGPRPLTLTNGNHDGNVVLGTSRLFVYQAGAVADGDWIDLVITKQGGGGAKITAATYDGASCSPVEVTFAKTDRANTQKRLLLSGVKGKAVFVKVDADGTQSFDYKFTANLGSGRPPSAGAR